ncbi:MAG: transcription elongation factor GreA [Candidatus Paceibacterota bacterium]|jgi:transcription elongation factor GreA
MNQAGNYITAEKRKALEAELKDLKGPKRKEILEALAYAKSLGDLSENAEYHQAREEQGKLETRIKWIEEILESSHTVKGGGGDIIEIGSKVVVQRLDAKGLPANEAGEKKYVIVGSQEADMAAGKISNHSPIGSALFGKKKGASVTFATPKGPVNYKIIDVS